jgi:putative FmdB family regulatory protein
MSCGHNFDVFQFMSDDPLETCPACGKKVRRVINGGSGIIFKGSGFYVNDSRKSSETALGGTSKSEASKADSAETKPSTDASKSDSVKTAGTETKTETKKDGKKGGS